MVQPLTWPDVEQLYDRYRDFDLLVDSRLLGVAERTLFLALPGARRRGVEFVADLAARGVRHFIVARADRPPLGPLVRQ